MLLLARISWELDRKKRRRKIQKKHMATAGDAKNKNNNTRRKINTCTANNVFRQLSLVGANADHNQLLFLA